MTTFQKPRGTQDIFGDKIAYWHFIEHIIRKQTHLYQIEEIRTPMFENYELFARGVGETSDIVSKEMYDFYDKGNRHLALKPESTATIVRALIENKLYVNGDYQKFYYISPHFRYERAQAGRYRQHHQFGVEIFGEKNPYVDAETILFVTTFLTKVGIKDFIVKLNSLGDVTSRIAHREALQKHFKPVLSELCEDCKQRFEKNPLRILDCKIDQAHPAMQNAPKIYDFLTTEARQYIDNVCSLLTEFNVAYEFDHKLVRGLDYYNHTVFEIELTDEKAAKAGSLGGGGRYDGLVAQNGGPELSGMGFGLGIERLILAMIAQGISADASQGEQKVFVANLDQLTTNYSMMIVQKLRQEGMNVMTNYTPKSMKAIFKMVERFEATDMIIIGEDEVKSQTFTYKNLEKREQSTYNIKDLLEIKR